MKSEAHIRHFADYPREGIVFHDISPLLADPTAFRNAIEELAQRITAWEPDVIAGIEARGFLIAAALSVSMNRGMVMIRKKGKLPGPTVSTSYDLEYGSASLEMQSDAIRPGARVVIVDDLLATGGTFRAAAKLTRSLGGHVCGAACIMELPDLGGRATLDMDMVSLIPLRGN